MKKYHTTVNIRVSCDNKYEGPKSNMLIKKYFTFSLDNINLYNTNGFISKLFCKYPNTHVFLYTRCIDLTYVQSPQPCPTNITSNA